MSAAFERMPRPDWAATTTIVVPEAGRLTSRQWAEAIFDVHAMPQWVRGLFGLRAVAAELLRLPQGDPSMVAVSAVVGDEAIVDTDDKHLRFVAGVHTEGDLLHVTTLVTFKGWRGQVYFAPVRFLHDPVTRSLMLAAARRNVV